MLLTGVHALSHVTTEARCQPLHGERHALIKLDQTRNGPPGVIPQRAVFAIHPVMSLSLPCHPPVIRYPAPPPPPLQTQFHFIAEKVIRHYR